MKKKYMTDIEIANSIKLKPITKIAREIGLNGKSIETYGKYKAKVLYQNIKTNPIGKVVLVTAINPTSAGEGKTTVSIGLNDALRKIGIKSLLTLREPSLGPVFGLKGGATGGGYAQVAPMEDINLHFTGDFHAITSANNLLASMIDNYIFQGNEIGIDPNHIVFKRCMDLNDRALREITVRSKAKDKEFSRSDSFNITAASEIMAILSLSKDMDDLITNLGNITIGYTLDNKPVYAKDIKAHNAMGILLKDAINPNLVQSLEHNPVLIHCGPFANIAHGCNSIIATDLARKLSDVVVTEAGFGADLGCEKFLDIKMRKMNIDPSAVVVVATVKALKLHGGEGNDIEKLIAGLTNLDKHLSNITNVFKLPCIVALNHYTSDTLEEIEIIKKKTMEMNIETILVEVWEKGGDGALELARKVSSMIEKENPKLNFAYDLNDPITEKIKTICTRIYGANDVIFTKKALIEIENINKLGLSSYPICLAKTQYSLSDDPNKLYIDKPFSITINDIELHTGSKMIVAIAGSMLLMPGLSKKPAAVNMEIKNGIIKGLF